jgi:hypothetical protein
VFFNLTDNFTPGPAAEKRGQVFLFDLGFEVASRDMVEKIGEEDYHIYVSRDAGFSDIAVSRTPVSYAGGSEFLEFGFDRLDAVGADN